MSITACNEYHVTETMPMSCFTEVSEYELLINCNDQVMRVPYHELEVIELCEDNTFNEVLFRVDGVLYGYYQGKDGFLTRIEPDKYYITSDGYKCSFYVDSDYNVIY
jgi:hypothetical protein